MDDFIKGDTLLIKDLTDEVNGLRQDNNRLLDELNTTKLTMANKEQERLDTLNDNTYYIDTIKELEETVRVLKNSNMDMYKELEQMRCNQHAVNALMFLYKFCKEKADK